MMTKLIRIMEVTTVRVDDEIMTILTMSVVKNDNGSRKSHCIADEKDIDYFNNSNTDSEDRANGNDNDKKRILLSPLKYIKDNINRINNAKKK